MATSRPFMPSTNLASSGKGAMPRSVTMSGRPTPCTRTCSATSLRAPGPKWIVVGNANREIFIDVACLRLPVADLDEAQLEDVVGPLCDADIGTRHPGQRAPVERDQRQVRVHDAQRIADELAAAGDVGLDADRVEDLIELRIGVTSAVEGAGAVRAIAVHHRVEAWPGVGERRPTELEEARRRLRELGKERRRRPWLERSADPDLRQHAGDGLAHRGPEAGVDAVERYGETVEITGFLQQRPCRFGIVRQATIELGQRTVDEPREIRACCGGLSAEHLGDDRVDVDRLIDGAPHAQILERIASLDIGEFELRTALVEAEILGADVGHLGELEALLLLQSRNVLKRWVDHEIDVT